MLISLPGSGVRAAAGQNSAWVGDWETIGSTGQGYFLYWAAGIAVDTGASSMKGRVYVAEPGEHRVRVREAGATTWNELPNNPFGPSDQPWDVAVDKTGHVYVANAIAAINGRAVWIYSPYTEQWTDITHGYHFRGPEGIAVDDSGNVYVANTSSPVPLEGTVMKLSSGGTSWAVIGNATSGTPLITEPTGIAVDGAGDVYITMHSANSGYLAKLPAGTSSWQLLRSHYDVRCGGVAADRFGNIYWTAGKTLQMFERDSPDNRVEIHLKPGNFNMPYGVAVDINGRVYVTERTSGSNGLILTHQGWASGLAWSTQPGSGVTGQSLAQQPVVRLVDAAGQTMTGVSGVTVQLSLNEPGGAALGYSTAALVNGVAAFTNLSVDLPGSYTLKAACGITSSPIYLYIGSPVYVNPTATFVSGSSAPFTVTQPPASAPVASPAAGSTVANGWQITLTSETPGATIRYTTDGSTPGAGSPGGTRVTVNGPKPLKKWL